MKVHERKFYLAFCCVWQCSKSFQCSFSRLVCPGLHCKFSCALSKSFVTTENFIYIWKVHLKSTIIANNFLWITKPSISWSFSEIPSFQLHRHLQLKKQTKTQKVKYLSISYFKADIKIHTESTLKGCKCFKQKFTQEMSQMFFNLFWVLIFSNFISFFFVLFFRTFTGKHCVESDATCAISISCYPSVAIHSPRRSLKFEEVTWSFFLFF